MILPDAVLAAIVAASGVLISQIITATFALRSKRIELLYTRKLDVYSRLMKASIMVAHGDGLEVGEEFLLTCQEVRLVCSEGVDKTLLESDGLIARSYKFIDARRNDQTNSDTMWKVGHDWSAALDRTVKAMQSELRGLSK